MKKLYKVAQKLNTTSEAIKDLINKKEISFEKKSGIYYVDENEVKNILGVNHTIKTTKNKRVTIFTVNMKNSQTIINDLKTLSKYGKKGTEGLGSFANVVGMAEVGLKNNFIIDEGAIIDECQIPLLYKEIQNGTNRESSEGSMELQRLIMERVKLDWFIWLKQIKDYYERETTIYHLMDVYFLSTAIYAVNKIK